MLLDLSAQLPKAAFYRGVAAAVGMPCSCFSYNHHAILACTAPLDSAVEIVVSDSSRPRLPYCCHHPKPARQTPASVAFTTRRRQLYWLEIAKVLYTTVGNCVDCPRNCNSLERECYRKLFLANGPLEFISRDKLDLLPNK